MGRFDVSSEEMKSGSIPRALIVLAIPLFAQNLVVVVKQVVDLFWVGQYSSNAVAAIGLAAPIYSIAISLSISGLFIATNILVSQRVGANNEKEAYRVAFNSLVLAITLGLAVGVSFYFGVDRLVATIIGIQPGATGAKVVGLSTIYLQVLSLGLVITGIANSIEANFLARGNSQATLYMNVVSVTVNLTLDPFLIFGFGPLPELGIAGAALASVAGSAASLMFGAGLASRHRSENLYALEQARLHLGDIKELVEIGYPRVGKGLASNVGSMAMVVIIFAAAGTAGLSAYVVGSRVIVLAMLVVKSLKSALQSIVGQNLGAGNVERASTTTVVGTLIAFIFLTVLAVGQWVFAPTIVKIFVPDIGNSSFRLSVEFLRIFAIAHPSGAVIALVKGGFNAARLTRTTMVATLTQTWALQIPMAVAGGIVLGFGAVGVFWARSLSIIITALLFGLYYVYKVRNGMFVRAAERAAAADGD